MDRRYSITFIFGFFFKSRERRLKFSRWSKRGKGEGLKNSKTLNPGHIIIILIKKKTEILLEKSVWLKRLLMITDKTHVHKQQMERGTQRQEWTYISSRNL